MFYDLFRLKKAQHGLAVLTSCDMVVYTYMYDYKKNLCGNNGHYVHEERFPRIKQLTIIKPHHF